MRRWQKILINGEIIENLYKYNNLQHFNTTEIYNNRLQILHELVIEEKGIYSIEKFIIARRLMYWQVYLHKTVLCAEQMLKRVIKRAKSINAQCNEPLFSFMNNHGQEINLNEFI